MRSRSRNVRAAFTLIELMIVVAITGILSMLAAYGVRKYIANSKTAEAHNALGRMANAAVIAYEDEHMTSPVLPPGTSTALTRSLCKSASKTVPAAASMIAGRKYQSNTSDWNADGAGNSGFACLHFTIDQPQYYMYAYAASGSSSPGDGFTATANGDLNGDGVLSTFQVTGAINASYGVNIAPNMMELSPDE
jgi:prepilin-type N-terminal cleavage/methylation domain-containing protein